MKKRLILMPIICLVFYAVSPFTAAAAQAQKPSLIIDTNPPSIEVNSVKINAPAPYVDNGVTWVPFRPIAEAFNIRVAWDNDTKTVIFIDYEGASSSFTIDGVNAVIVEGRTFVPYDFLTGLNFEDNNIMKRLGYSKEFISVMVNEDREIFREIFTNPVETWNLRRITRALPYPSWRSYRTAEMQSEPVKTIIIEYQFDENNPFQGGNGLDPFYESVSENNAFILFSLIEDLEQVQFLHYFGDVLNRTDSYTLDALSERFGRVNPLTMNAAELYDALSANIRTSEFYFSHYSRIYLGAEYNEIIYRNGEPDEIKDPPGSPYMWMVYNNAGADESMTPAGLQENPVFEHRAYYYFKKPLSEEGDGGGLHAAKFTAVDGESYLELSAYLGFPDIIKDMGDGHKYIAYSLRDGQQKNAYFILQNDKVIAEGVMYGSDYTIFDLEL